MSLSTTSVSSFNWAKRLPDGPFLLVTDFLDMSSVSKIQQVCKEWKRIVKEDPIYSSRLPGWQQDQDKETSNRLQYRTEVIASFHSGVLPI